MKTETFLRRMMNTIEEYLKTNEMPDAQNNVCHFCQVMAADMVKEFCRHVPLDDIDLIKKSSVETYRELIFQEKIRK